MYIITLLCLRNIKLNLSSYKEFQAELINLTLLQTYNLVNLVFLLYVGNVSSSDVQFSLWVSVLGLCVEWVTFYVACQQ